MTKEFLERCLAEALSLEQIGERAGKHASTVSYHLQKHGLAPLGRAAHSPNGKVDPERLRDLIERGATIREAAAALDVGYTTIRHWVKRLGLETSRMVRLRESKAAMDRGETRVTLRCGRHGWASHFRREDGRFRCAKCRTQAVSDRRRKVKLRLVERAGGSCLLCGYDRHPGALHFHHLDRSSKRFTLSRNGVTRSYAEAKAEADKCVLLCGNCHAEVEAGVRDLPPSISALKLLDG